MGSHGAQTGIINGLLTILLISSFLSVAEIKAVVRPDYGYSSYCQPCTSPCESNPEKEGKYTCKTDHWSWRGSVYTWDYCSLNDAVDYLDKNCTSDCAFHGEEYQWCVTEKSWGHCSGKICKDRSIELPHYGYSTFCQRCITPCEQQGGTKTYWCGTRQWTFEGKGYSWDYCSPNNQVDYLGNNCQNKCTFRGKNFMNCGTKEGGKGYCTGKGNVLCDFITPFN